MKDEMIEWTSIEFVDCERNVVLVAEGNEGEAAREVCFSVFDDLNTSNCSRVPQIDKLLNELMYVSTRPLLCR